MLLKLIKVISEHKREKNWKKEIKTTATVIKLSLQHFPMSDGNTVIAKSNLEVLSLI